jgi:hypothetical protein
MPACAGMTNPLFALRRGMPTIAGSDSRNGSAGRLNSDIISRNMSRAPHFRMITSSVPHNALLARHAETSSKFVSGIEVRVLRTEDSCLAFGYVLTADLSNLRIPFSVSPRRADRLWEHTCFEAFVRGKGQAGYCEFNFSPSGEWAAYAFREYREGGPTNDDQLNPKIAVQRKAETLELHAVIRLDRLSRIQPGSILRLGLSAVVEDIDGRLSYWALKHPPGKPDFHHPDAFAMELAVPGLKA